jgi:protein-tyrosine phosphatase
MYHLESSKTVAGSGGLPAHAPGTLVDLHCHCLPGFDDGPASCSQAVALCRTLTRHNVHTVVATPHQLGRFEGRTMPGEIRIAVRQLNQRLDDEGIDLTVLPGAEVRIDERISDLLSQDAILTLADMHRHILLELSRETFIDIEPLALQLQSQGIDLIIAHPERSVPLLGQQRILRRWLTRGVSLQVTAGSLTGDFGSQAEDIGWAWMAEGWVAAVASDAHGSPRTSPRMTEAFNLIKARFGRDLACVFCVDNPSRVVRGERLTSPCSPGRQEVW